MTDIGPAEDQGPVIAFLLDPATHGVAPGDVRTIETHISVVVLAGDRAFKLKRAVRLPYVDFSTTERRLAACRQELELNRRTAPMLYRAVRRITREGSGGLVFDGGGRVVDAVVEMARFDEETLFDRMAARGALTPPLLTELARQIARFHALADSDRSRPGAARMAAVLDINERALGTTHLFAPAAVAAFNAAFRAALDRHAPLLDSRARLGKVRRCHGDLHLRNICLVGGVPTLFDCIEFDRDMATIDVLYDLAFLVMDLWHRGLRPAANLVLNRYLDDRDESDGLALMPFFMAVRGSVRAHVTATQAEGAESESGARLAREAKAYFDLALELLAPVPPRLVAIGGLSGTGKSTVAAAVADRLGPPPGARVLASDRIRKRLHGVSAETRLPPEAYRPEISERVYAAQAEEARTVLENGHAAIADAVFDRPSDRDRMARIAAALGVPFAGLWLEAPPAVLVARVAARRGDASDATTEVVRAQLDRDPGTIGWKRIGAGDDAGATAARALELIDASLYRR
jgi:aminoglycoside phosphotransferase family enzyme/predicted kinase